MDLAHDALIMETADCPFVCISMQLLGPSILNNTNYVHAFNPSYAHLQGQATNLSQHLGTAK